MESFLLRSPSLFIFGTYLLPSFNTSIASGDLVKILRHADLRALSSFHFIFYLSTPCHYKPRGPLYFYSIHTILGNINLPLDLNPFFSAIGLKYLFIIQFSKVPLVQR